MILSIREYPEDPTTVEDSTTPDVVAGAKYQYEYIVDMTSIDAKRPIIFKQKGPALANASNSEEERLLKSVEQVFVELFLPIGYPHSVDASYLPYQLYDGLQGLCSYWRGVVATRAVLEAAGVGDAQATAASAAMQWALRDGTGMLGGLVFSYVASARFDTHVKEFRLFADVINDVALTLDMLAPYVEPDSRLILLSLSTIGKTLCGMSAGATKGRITQHFSKHGNMADLSAKESTQETLVSLLGMIGGVAVAHLLQNMPYSVTWLLFGVLTLVHVWANYKGVKLLKLATLNPERTCEVLKPLLKVLAREGSDKELEEAFNALPTPEEIDESLAQSTIKLLFPTIQVDTPVIAANFQFAAEFSQERYLIGVKKDEFFVYLRLGATLQDELAAYVNALLLQQMQSSNDKPVDSKLVKWSLGQIARLRTSQASSKDGKSSLWAQLEAKGWDLQSRLYLGFDSQRVQWSILKEPTPDAKKKK